MKKVKEKYLLREKRRKRIRRKIFGTEDKPRLSVYKSNRYLYAQLINDERGETLASVSSVKEERFCAKDLKIAEKLGKELAKKAKDKGINQLVFDRSGYPYYGRIKALAENLRKEGLKF
ncbi:MAG: 50S ribosomal protein L18 [Candidatus Aerophobetes bacterium]|nr:50S ribosomal protein L18 [Candidatus Aerophobetes bacterium]